MYTYEKFNIILFPWFLLIIGVVLLLAGMYTQGGLAVVTGALFSISFAGFNIDASQMRIRQYDRFLWFYFGSWKPLKNPLYVTVVRIRLSNRRNSPLPFPTPGSGKDSISFKLNLVIEDKSRYIPLAHGKRIEMLQEGLKIARLLHIKLLDHTSNEKQWIS